MIHTVLGDVEGFSDRVLVCFLLYRLHYFGYII